MSKLTQCSEKRGGRKRKGLSHFLSTLPCTQRRLAEELWHNPPTCNSLMAAINTFTCLWVHSYTALQHNKSINRSDRCLTSLRRCRLIQLWLSRVRMWIRRTCGCWRHLLFIGCRYELGNAMLELSFLCVRMLVNKTTEISSQPNIKNILFAQTTFPNQKSPNSKDSIKTVLKTASLQFTGGFLPNVAQKPQKRSSCQEWVIKKSPQRLCLETVQGLTACTSL